MIPEAPAAYALGVQHALGCDWGSVAAYLQAAGFPAYPPDELAAAAEGWAREHVAPELLENLARSRRGRKATREQGGPKSPKTHKRSRGARK